MCLGGCRGVKFLCRSVWDPVGIGAIDVGLNACSIFWQLRHGGSVARMIFNCVESSVGANAKGTTTFEFSSKILSLRSKASVISSSSFDRRGGFGEGYHDSVKGTIYLAS